MKVNPLNKQSGFWGFGDKIKKEDKFRMKYKNNSPSNS